MPRRAADDERHGARVRAPGRRSGGRDQDFGFWDLGCQMCLLRFSVLFVYGSASCRRFNRILLLSIAASLTRQDGNCGKCSIILAANTWPRCSTSGQGASSRREPEPSKYIRAACLPVCLFIFLRYRVRVAIIIVNTDHIGFDGFRPTHPRPSKSGGF
jgi:hypothetical protein